MPIHQKVKLKTKKEVQTKKFPRLKKTLKKNPKKKLTRTETTVKTEKQNLNRNILRQRII